MADQEVPQTELDVAIETATAPTASENPKLSKWYRWRKDGKDLAAYLLDSELHTFAFSVAANVILSFIPFIVLLYALARAVFNNSETSVKAVDAMVNYFIPIHTKTQNWLANQLDNIAVASTRHGLQLFSLVMILVACTGVFLPLEVALNQAWGVVKSRNYLMNQLVAFGLAAVMVALGMISIAVNTMFRVSLAVLFFNHTDNWAYNTTCYVVMAATTGVAAILFFFSIYWVMPNCKIPVRPVFKTAIWTGVIWLAARVVFELILPLMDLPALYGPFSISVSLLFWAYFSGIILFAGAQLSVSRMGLGKKEK